MNLENKALLLGDEAIALGAIHAGISGVYAYPGTPSTEITEYIQHSAEATDVYSDWCVNEKTAMEAALGMSYVGKRALVCMKHVGMNVAADAFVNSAVSGINGGVVVLAADDPSMHSSQNEQDSRFYGKFAMIPILEPSSQQEAYDIMSYAFDLSESLREPVLLRITTRMAHSRAVVVTGAKRAQNEIHFSEEDLRRWVLLPVTARRRYNELVALQAEMVQRSEESTYNLYHEGADKSIGVVASGIAWNYLNENYPDGLPFSAVKVSQYPLPKGLIARLVAECDKVLVLEDGQPFIEEQLRGLLDMGNITGRLDGAVPRVGELTPDNIKPALGIASTQVFEPSAVVVGRPPAMCTGCGHRDVYAALNKIVAEYESAKVFSDIGCYTLGALPPFNAIDSTIDMGASVTMAKGASDAGHHPAIAVIGDSTFTHSGMTGLLDAVNSNSRMTLIISDNLTTAMTGGQDSAGTNRIEAICKGLGVDADHIRFVVPLPKNMEQIEAIIREEVEYDGLSVIIPRRECIQTMKKSAKK
ncbi:MAG: thiamine pyrophosphate-dependent enzyme [Rikenellaceae bacterium]